MTTLDRDLYKFRKWLLKFESSEKFTFNAYDDILELLIEEDNDFWIEHMKKRVKYLGIPKLNKRNLKMNKIKVRERCRVKVLFQVQLDRNLIRFLPRIIEAIL